MFPAVSSLLVSIVFLFLLKSSIVLAHFLRQQHNGWIFSQVCVIMPWRFAFHVESVLCFSALTERVVEVLPQLKCPHSLEPHQIQGLDYIHIFPVVQVTPFLCLTLSIVSEWDRVHWVGVTLRFYKCYAQCWIGAEVPLGENFGLIELFLDGFSPPFAVISSHFIVVLILKEGVPLVPYNFVIFSSNRFFRQSSLPM